MVIDEHIQKTLEELRGKLNAKIAEARKSLSTINSIEEDYGLPKTTLADFGESIEERHSSDGRTDSPYQVQSLKSIGSIRPDEYLGLKPVAAAKKYIKRIGHAVGMDDIVRAIQAGGAAISGSKWQEDLKKSLATSNADVIKVQDGVFGLVEFYTPEQIKGIRDARRQSESQKESKRGK